MNTVLRLSSACLLASAALVGQSVVFPSTMTNVTNGNSYISWFPFSDGISRLQVVYDDWDLGLQPNTPITRIGFRQDSTQTSVSRLVQLEVRMGTTTSTSSTIGTTFDSNFAGTPTTVFPLGIFTLPALSSSTPNSIVWVNLTTPYTYPGGNLLVEFRVYGNNNGNQSFYYPLDSTGYVSTVTAGTQGCVHSGGQRAALASSPTQVGSYWNLYLSSAPASTALALLVAPDQTMPSPFSLSFLGLDPSCLGQIPANFASFSGSTNTGGGASWSVQVPNSLALNNFTITSQAVIFDFFVPGSLVTSNADQITFGIAPPESIVAAQGSATATTGSVYPNYGVVTLFN